VLSRVWFVRAEEGKVTEVTATLPGAKSRMTCARLDWPNDLRIMRTQAGSVPFAKSSTLFNGLQIRRFDPFCSVMIRSDRAIITISLQSAAQRANLEVSSSLRFVSHITFPEVGSDPFVTAASARALVRPDVSEHFSRLPRASFVAYAVQRSPEWWKSSGCDFQQHPALCLEKLSFLVD
jgi:hypothetical protein